MKAQQLTTNIVINAKTGSGFSEVGNTLTELDSLINGISQELINFGVDSAKVYRDYEKSMKDAQVALSTIYGRGTQELARVMDQLDVSATEWAATTIFHTDDVANAISEASHAGWDLDQILSGMPAAMQLAQAGSLDLSQAVNYIVKATNAAGIGFEDLNYFTDLWTFAANSSASTVEEFGNAMLRMGSTMKFAGSTEELMTLIAATANAGAVGTEAGTMIRNSLMRLISPTKKASDVMESLGATTDEISEIMNDAALAETNAALAARGFSAYDQNGQLRGSLEIFTSLAAVMADIAGGYENIGKNETTLKMLGSIFPTRTITEALNLINAAANGWNGLYDAMMGGEAYGYGEYAAVTMMDTLYGSTEPFESKVERLKQLVGAELAPQIENALGFAGELVDSLAEMNPTAFNALVDGLGVVAVAGPGLLLAGGALRVIGMLANPVGLTATALLLLAAGGVAAANAINGMRNEDFLSQFGDMTIESGPLLADLQKISDGFYGAYEAAYQFRQNLDEAVKSYETAASGLTSNLLSQMVTGMTLTDADIARLNGLGDQMHDALTKALTSGYREETSYWNTFFGGGEEAEKNPLFQQLIDSASEHYSDAIAEAEELSQQLRSAMTSAFEDGTITAEEYENIRSVIQAYNDAIAQAETEAAEEEAYVNRKMLLQKGQTADISQVIDISRQFEEQRDEELARREEEFYRNYYRQQHRGADQATLDKLEADFRVKQADVSATYNKDLLGLWTQSIKDSDLAGAFERVSELAAQYRSGTLSGENASYQAGQELDRGGLFETSELDNLSRALGTAVSMMGGEEEMLKTIEGLRAGGNMEAAEELASFLAASLVANGFKEVTRADEEKYKTGYSNTLEGRADAVLTAGYKTEQARSDIQYFTENRDETLANYINRLGQAIESGNQRFAGAEYSGMTDEAKFAWQEIVTSMKGAYDFSEAAKYTSSPLAAEGNPVRNEAIAYELMFGDLAGKAESFRITVEPVVDTAQIDAQMPDSVPVQVDTYTEGDPLAELRGLATDVQINGDTTQITAIVNDQTVKTIETVFQPDMGGLEQAEITIQDMDGTPIMTFVNGDNSDAMAAINAVKARDGETVTITIRQITEQITRTREEKFAEGGRATTASIFGEAGPEWAIPEEHTQRTAELLNAARTASGFSWAELISQFGGLNANPKNQSTTIVYSPTINANDASGVDKVLKDDKQRLEQWLRDKKLLDEMEVYT